MLNKLKYQTGGLYINLGITSESHYSNESQRLTKSFADQRNLPLLLVDINSEYGKTIPEFSESTKRGKAKPCSICGLVKRHTMNEIAAKFDYDVLVTGHNLDDEMAVLFNNVMSWQVDFLKRQAPFIPAKKGLLPKAKPFCRFYERETAAYAILSGIEYIEEECPFSVGSTTIQNKELLNTIENKRAGAKLAFYLKFLEAKNQLFSLENQNQPTIQLFTCPTCGQPTQKEGQCAFCRLVAKR